MFLKKKTMRTSGSMTVTVFMLLGCWRRKILWCLKHDTCIWEVLYSQESLHLHVIALHSNVGKFYAFCTVSLNFFMYKDIQFHLSMFHVHS